MAPLLELASHHLTVTELCIGNEIRNYEPIKVGRDNRLQLRCQVERGE